jgi:hypothetical protein
VISTATRRETRNIYSVWAISMAYQPRVESTLSDTTVLLCHRLVAGDVVDVTHECGA